MKGWLVENRASISNPLLKSCDPQMLRGNQKLRYASLDISCGKVLAKLCQERLKAGIIEYLQLLDRFKNDANHKQCDSSINS